MRGIKKQPAETRGQRVERIREEASALIDAIWDCTEADSVGAEAARHCVRKAVRHVAAAIAMEGFKP